MMRFITLTIDDDDPTRPAVTLDHEGVSMYEIVGVLTGALHWAQCVVEDQWNPNEDEDESTQ